MQSVHSGNELGDTAGQSVDNSLTQGQGEARLTLPGAGWEKPRVEARGGREVGLDRTDGDLPLFKRHQLL